MNFIFDLYGTLADIRTDEESGKFKNYVEKLFGSLNPAVDFWAEYEKLCALKTAEGGENREIDLYSVFREIAGDSPEKKLEKAVKLFREKSRSRLKLYRGVKSGLGELKKNGARLFILSNAQECFTLAEIEKLGLTLYFDGIELSSTFGKKKPAPEFFEHILKKYGLDSAKSVYAGNDLCADICGARAVGLETAYVLSNISPEEDSIETAEKLAGFAARSHKELFDYLVSLQNGDS